MSDWNFAAVWDGLAKIVPDRDALVWSERRVTWAEFADRADRVARHLHREAGLVPGDRIAIEVTNRPEYLESFYAALKLGCVPVNVNFRYRAAELRYLLDNSDARALVHEAAFTDTVAEAVARIAPSARPYLLEVGAPYEQAVAASTPTGDERARTPSGDDLIFLYTGGTTGMPKGVMWRNDDLYVSLWASAHPDRPDPPDPFAAASAGKRASTLLPAAPLMHGTGLFAALAALAGSGTIVLVDHAGLDPELVWDAVARERVQTLTIVGDVFARPLLDALRAHPDRWDLSSLRAITSSGVLFSPDVKRGLLDHLDGVTIVDALGASEGLGPRQSARAADGAISAARFSADDRIRVVHEDTGRDVVAGSGEVGVLAIGGRIPLGYFKDPDRSAATFRVLDGVRYSVPGDHATVAADGTVRLLGRGSACINTGGEKVYPEEVEAELREHPGVFDCVVVGVPDERYGERVVALVQRVEGVDDHDADDGDEAAMREWCRDRMAGYKVPRRFLFVDSLRRSAAGKAPHGELRALAVQLLADGAPAA
jgi:acyl-CoA synthetase (AMP-forming)/AMP-acid ligase II